MTCTATAFGPMAAGYDRDFGENPVGRRLRRMVWHELFGRLPAGATLLDLGCGTGLDACEAARRGHRVVAVDGAAAMLAEAQAKRDRRGLAGSVTLVRADLNRRSSRRALLARARPDAALADFGVINCIEDLETFASDLFEGLAPGAGFLAVVMGRWAPWEIGYHLLKGRPRRALGRLGSRPVRVPVGEGSVRVRYYTPGAFCRPFRSGFRVRGVRALGAFLPPPYLAPRLVRAGVDLDALAGLERGLGRWWPARALGDHFLAVLERK